MSTCRLALLSFFFLAACQSDKDGDSAAASDSGTVAATGDGTTEDFEGDEAGECSDGADNDRDGLFDCEDPGCVNSPDCASGETGGGTTDGGGSSSSRSCQFGSQICIETSAPDPGAWCAAEGGDSSESACSSDYTSYCIIPPSDNPTYMYAATAYYYDNFDASAACTDVGGTYVG